MLLNIIKQKSIKQKKCTFAEKTWMFDPDATQIQFTPTETSGTFLAREREATDFNEIWWITWIDFN